MIFIGEWPDRSPSFRRNRKVRMEFAENHWQKDSEFWKTFILADDNKCNIFGLEGRNYVWGIPGEASRAKRLRPAIQHGGSVIVWGCMAASGVGNLHFVGGSMNRHVVCKHSSKTSESQSWKTWNSRKFCILPLRWPQNSSHLISGWCLYIWKEGGACTFGKRVVLVHLLRGWCLYIC
jgi:hypothetical protein